jgi:hypothetical protein
MKKLSARSSNTDRRKPKTPGAPYRELLSGVVGLIEQARLSAVRSVNVFLTSTYWLVGQRIVEHEQAGRERAGYGQGLLKRLSLDLTVQLGRGFSERNLEQMRLFYLGWPNSQTVSAESASPAIWQTLSAKSGSWPVFPLPWSHYVRLLSVPDTQAREYYEREAMQGGWSVRQLDRQISTMAYQRTGSALTGLPKDAVLPVDAHVRDPFVLEFLNLKTSIRRPNSKTRSSNAWNSSYRNWEAISRLWPDKSVSGWEPNGIEWIWSSSTASFDVLSSWT